MYHVTLYKGFEHLWILESSGTLQETFIGYQPLYSDWVNLKRIDSLGLRTHPSVKQKQTHTQKKLVAEE